MAVGLSRMIGVRIPINFFSPYQAASIIEFWGRWHISLSSFLRNYLYFPLGGNRRGTFRRYVNLMLVMALGGLWHGANWTFLLWGTLHGIYLLVNHAWREVVGRSGTDASKRFGLSAGVVLTFVAVTLAWVPFRADSIAATLRMWSTMLNPADLVIPAKVFVLLGPLTEVLAFLGIHEGDPFPLTILSHDATIPALLLAVWLLPNSQQLFARFEPALVPAAFRGRISRWAWSPNLPWTLALASAAAYSIFMGTKTSEFLYFQF